MLMADLLVPERFLPTDEDLCRCALKLQESPLFETHGDYIRRQFVQCLLEVCCAPVWVGGESPALAMRSRTVTD